MIDYIRFEESYKDQVVDFLGEYISGVNKNKRKEIFEWVYEKNPYVQHLLAYLAVDRDKVVGFRGFIPQKFKVNDNFFRVIVPTNGTVHPDYRRKGIFTKLSEFSLDDISDISDMKLILSLSPNEAATKALKKAGYVPVGQRRKLYFLSILNFFKKTRDGLSNKNNTLLKEGDFQIEITDELKSEKISRLMEKYVEDHKLTNVRDPDFYKWRFEESPQDNIFIYCEKDNELLGYLVIEQHTLSISSDKQIEYYMLMEYGYTKKKYLEKLLDILVDELSIPGIMSYMFTRRDEEISLFKKYGFKDGNHFSLKLIGRIFNTDRISDVYLPGAMLKPASKNIEDKDFVIFGKDARKVKNWSLFRSDVH